MPADEATKALHRLYVAHAVYESADSAKGAARLKLTEAVSLAVEAGISKTDIGRAVGLSSQRIHQMLDEAS